MRRWSDWEDVELARLAAGGATMNDAAVALSRSLDSIKARAHGLGIRFDGPRGRRPLGEMRGRTREDGMWTRQQDRNLIECLASNWSVSDIAKELGVTEADVRARVRELIARAKEKKRSCDG